ncbi:MAG: hypothetical protein U0Q19_13585 [Kineosporiaceae bacterium]
MVIQDIKPVQIVPAPRNAGKAPRQSAEAPRRSWWARITGWQVWPASERAEIDDIVIETEESDSPFHWQHTQHH